MNPFLIGFPALAFFGLLAYVAQEIALKRLEPIQIGTLSLALRKRRITYVVSMAGALVIFLGFRFSLPAYTDTFFLLFLSAAAMLTAGSEWLAWSTVQSLSPPPPFISAYRVWRFLALAAVLSILFAMAATPFMAQASE